MAVLQWLRGNGAPWNEWTCTYAAQDGHVAVLEWRAAEHAAWRDGADGRGALSSRSVGGQVF